MQTTIASAEKRFGAAKETKGVWGQKQGIKALCHMRQTLHWLLSGALILLKGSIAAA